VGRLVIEAWRSGARLDGWNEHFNLERWTEAARAVGVDPDVYASAVPLDQTLPWHGVSSGVSRDFLRRELERAHRGETTGDCRVDACALCGACDTPRAGLCRLAAEAVPETAPSLQPPRPPVARLFYRFVFRKGRQVRFLGHLDMVGILHRAFAAADLPVAHSQGFTPLPRIAFGPPLGLGVAGEAEIFDAEMTRPLDPEQWRAADAWLPEGLRLVACLRLDGKPVAVSGATAAARYRFEPLRALDREVMAERIAAILAASSLVVTIEKKGAPAEKDIRPLVHEAQAVEISPGAWGAEATLSAAAGRTCKPAEFLAKLFPGARTADFLITRLECLAGTPGKWVRLG
jgi:radical SAM-linked protein